jgi:hypothetical protein
VPHDLKARDTLPAGPEVRTYPASFELRSLPGTKVELSGYASTTEAPYDMWDMFGSYTEVVRAGAFAKTIAEGADVAYLANHEGLTLARSKNGTLRLSEDSTGLLTVATLNTSRGDARDLVTAVEDGDVDQMSFAFRVVRQAWSPDYDERSLTELNLDRGDVSAVNFGANPATSVGLARAFRGRRPAEIHRMAVELREGKSLSAATMDTLAQVLDLVASADSSVDAAQPLLAGLMGVPNPDDPGEDKTAAEADGGDGERSAGYLALLSLAEAERHYRRTA